MLLSVFMMSVSCLAAPNQPTVKVDNDYYLDVYKQAIGGINLNSSPEYIKSIYGEPTSEEKRYNYTELVYGDSFRILYNNTIQRSIKVETTADNGIGTDSGVTVGMSESVIIDLYGDPSIYGASNRKYTRTTKDGVTTYTYGVPKSGGDMLVFKTQSGKIISIGIYGCD